MTLNFINYEIKNERNLNELRVRSNDLIGLSKGLMGLIVKNLVKCPFGLRITKKIILIHNNNVNC